MGSLKKKIACRFIDYGDDRMTAAATVYSLQALFFFLANGEPFCKDKSCRLYNAHLQEELIHVIEKGAFSAQNKRMTIKFNNKRSEKPLSSYLQILTDEFLRFAHNFLGNHIRFSYRNPFRTDY